MGGTLLGSCPTVVGSSPASTYFKIFMFVIEEEIKFKFNANSQEHPYFLVMASISPLLTSISLTLFVTEVINFFYFLSKSFILSFSFLTLFLILVEWFFKISLESDFHTKAVQLNNQVSFILFILSEIMFFFSLF